MRWDCKAGENKCKNVGSCLQYELKSKNECDPRQKKKVADPLILVCFHENAKWERGGGGLAPKFLHPFTF